MAYVERRLATGVSSLLADEPVVVVQGPRTVGKSVLLAQLAGRLGVAVLDLDDPASAEAVAADPALFAKGPAPVVVDEYQRVPELLGAIKAELNRDLRPGRFVLAGSTRSDAVPELSAHLAGRVHLLSLFPFSEGEIDGVGEDLVETLVFGDPAGVVGPARVGAQREDYIARAVRGGFPIAVARRSEAARQRWFGDYVVTVLERDVAGLAQLRQREQLPRLLRHLASRTGQLLNVTAAAEAAGLDRGTAAGYLALLEAVFLVRVLPAWGTTLRRRTSTAPKVHVVDSGLAAQLLGLSAARLARVDPAAMSELGHLLADLRRRRGGQTGELRRGHRANGALAQL